MEFEAGVGSVGGGGGILERRKVIEKVHSYNYKWGLVY